MTGIEVTENQAVWTLAMLLRAHPVAGSGALVAVPGAQQAFTSAKVDRDGLALEPVGEKGRLCGIEMELTAADRLIDVIILGVITSLPTTSELADLLGRFAWIVLVAPDPIDPAIINAIDGLDTGIRKQVFISSWQTILNNFAKASRIATQLIDDIATSSDTPEIRGLKDAVDVAQPTIRGWSIEMPDGASKTAYLRMTSPSGLVLGRLDIQKTKGAGEPVSYVADIGFSKQTKAKVLRAWLKELETTLEKSSHFEIGRSSGNKAAKNTALAKALGVKLWCAHKVGKSHIGICLKSTPSAEKALGDLAELGSILEQIASR